MRAIWSLQFIDWFEGAREAWDRAQREPDAGRRAQLAVRAANWWERTATEALRRETRDAAVDAAVFLRRAADAWHLAGDEGAAADAIKRARCLDAGAGTPLDR